MRALLTLAVYAATALAMLGLAHRFVTPLRLRMAVLLAALPLLFTGPAMVTGGVYGGIDILYDAMPLGAHRGALRIPPDRSPSLGDVVYQHIPWRAAVRRAAAEGRFPLWNPSVLAGEPLAAVQQAGILRPSVWIGMLLPPAQAWTFDVTVRLLTALLCAYLFLRDLGCGPAPALLGAAGWAFSDFFVFFLGFSIAPPTAPFPLALLGARRVVREASPRSAVLFALALAAALAGGHPETALHTGSAAELYFLFELTAAPRGRRLRSCALALASAALAVGLCAVILLPMAEILPVTQEYALRKNWYALQKRSVALTDSVFRLAPQLVPYAVGVDGKGSVKEGYIVPSAYAGALLFPFAFAGLFARRRERWFFLGLGLASLAVSIKTVAADWIAKLPFFDIAINEYLIVLATFSLCVLAAFGAESVSRGQRRAALFAGAALTALAILAVAERFRPLMNELKMPPSYRHERLLLQLAPLGAAVGAFALLGKRRAAAGACAAAAVFVGARVLEEGRVNPSVPDSGFYPPLSILSKVPRGAPERMAAVGINFLPNIAAVYDVEDVRGYSAMTLRAMMQTYPLWCVPQGTWFNRVDDPTRPFLSFLNVRWVLLPRSMDAPPGWPVVDEGEGLRLVENPRALSRAFAPKRYRGEPDEAKRLVLLGAVSDFGEEGVVDAETGGAWVTNGSAEVAIESYSAQRLTLRVNAAADALVGTSIPNWPGWRVLLDGRPIGAVAFNHSFLGFHVPAGSHHVTVRYSPDGARYGVAISLTAAAAALLLIGLARGRRLAGAPTD